jgi:hypothetical protein
MEGYAFHSVTREQVKIVRGSQLEFLKGLAILQRKAKVRQLPHQTKITKNQDDQTETYSINCIQNGNN